MLKNKGRYLLGAVLAVAFAYGLVNLLLLRFSAGDVFPYYSSLRSDPLGVKVLYESLETCCDLKVSRAYDPITSYKGQSNSAFFDLGDRASGLSFLDAISLDDVETYVRNGGRLVITFLPYKSNDDLNSELLVSSLSSMGEDMKHPLVDVRERWGFNYFGFALSSRKRENAAVLKDSAGAALPPQISVHTVLYFSDLSKPWKIIYDRGGHPVLVERAMGKGSIVLSAESFFLSNEAMIKERHPELVVWLVGGKHQVIFDEYDHGVAYSPGVASLIRKYNLQWLVVGAVLLALLFVWKSAASLVPAYRDDEDESPYSLSRGNDATSGLANLLRRSVPISRMFSLCYQEWKKSQKSKYAVKLSRVEALVSGPENRKNVVKSYNQVSRILAERK